MRVVPDTIRVLHVVDEPGFAELAARGLENEDIGFTVETASTAGDALECLDEADVDCVVSGHDLADGDGIELLESVREQDPDIPFILYTGEGSEAVASRAISAGATEYLVKKRDTDQFEVLANRIRNVVVQYRAERQARATRRRFQRLIEESTDVIVVAEPDGELTYLSPAAERVLGYPPADLVGENGFAYIHEADRDQVAEEFLAVVHDPDREPAVEFRFAQEDGSWRWLEARGRNLLADPEIEGIVVYARDITARKAHERSLRRERNRYQALFEAVPEPTVRVRFDEADRPIVREVNEAFESVFGYPQAELEGNSIDAFIVPDDAAAEAARIGHVTARGESIEKEVRRMTVDGPREFLLRTNPLETAGASTESIGIYVDITDDRERERKLERRNDQLEEFASVVSHDLRNPLNVAAGRLALAAEDCDSEHLGAVRRAHDRMEALIDDLLTLAREGEQIGEVGPVALPELTAQCWQHVETESATLDVETQQTIRGDPTRLQQLLENLLLNAVQHGGPDVSVTVGDLGDGFYIEDDGPGVPAGERDQVFRPGYTTGGDGTGFGLPIVKRIVEGHGWSITVTDGTAGGARFEIRGVEIGGA